LDFIGDEEDVVLLAEFRRSMQINLRRNDDAVFTLDGFQHHRGGVGADSGFQRCQVPNGIT
jgi:hypothetical protein